VVRGIILGGLAFVAVFAAERQFENLSKDIDRYNSLREMSGESSFFKQALKSGLDLLSSFGGSGGGDGLSFFAAMQQDVVRYARISAM
jgi:hypothetical protein